MSDLARKQLTALLSALTEKMISCDYDPRSYWSIYEWLIKNYKLPFGVGVYTLSEDKTKLICVKKARQKDRRKPLYEMLLMMLRSARRDHLMKSNKESFGYDQKTALFQ